MHLSEHASSEEIVIIVKKVGERVSPSKKVLKNVISPLKAESAASMTSKTEGKACSRSSAAPALAEAFFAVFVVNLAFRLVAEGFISFGHFLEN